MSSRSARRSIRRSRSFPLRSTAFLPTAFSLAALTCGLEAAANTVALEWDPVEDERVAFYEVHWGTQSGQYAASQQTTATSATIDQLAAGETYFFAAKACDETGATCSDFSEELSTTVDDAAPVADFSASTTSGEAPLAVTFDANPEGAVADYAWDFGDGHTSTAGTAVHSYEQAGTYSVSLTVTGPGGSHTETKTGLITVSEPASDPLVGDDDGASDDSGSTTETTGTERDLPLEAGDLAVNHEWRRVAFAHSFTDPVVVVTAVSHNGGAPVTVRIDDVDPTGFSIRLQEWDYLDGTHATETVGYLVVERGRHQLPNGAWLEADTLPVGAGESWQAGHFIAPFASTPVVLSSVATDNDPSAVTTRMRGIDATGFELMLQGAENDGIAHGSEQVAYVATEGFCGALNGRQVVIGKTADTVTHDPMSIAFAEHCAEPADGFTPPPTFLAAMQTTDGADTANLRWANKGTDAVEVWVDEEQSRDDEVYHTSEVVGFFAMGEATPTAPLAIELGEIEVGDAWQRVDLQQSFVDPVVVAKLRSAQDAEPALVRIKAVDASGFSLRVQEWDYQDGVHAPELVSYMVVERGRHQLPNGAWIEAGRRATNTTGAFESLSFSAAFEHAPVVLTAVSTEQDPAAVTARLRNISATGFEAGLFEEEASDQVHAAETIGYVALEPSTFVLDGLAFEAGRTADTITHAPSTLTYAVQGAQLPLLFAQMQSSDGYDTAALRADQVDHGSATVWVEEEQSFDSETWHTSESAGYLVIY